MLMDGLVLSLQETIGEGKARRIYSVQYHLGLDLSQAADDAVPVILHEVYLKMRRDLDAELQHRRPQ